MPDIIFMINLTFVMFLCIFYRMNTLTYIFQVEMFLRASLLLFVLVICLSGCTAGTDDCKYKILPYDVSFTDVRNLNSNIFHLIIIHIYI